MKAYLWDQHEHPVKILVVEDPIPRWICLPTMMPGFERVFYRQRTMTWTDDARDPGEPLRPKTIGIDYVEDPDSPREVKTDAHIEMAKAVAKALL